MPEESSSWCSAETDEIKLTAKQRKQGISNRDAKLKILHQILQIIECLRMEREYIVVKGENEYEKLKHIENKTNISETRSHKGLFQHVAGERGLFSTNFDDAISFFISLNQNGIVSRLYFVLGKEIDTFVEYVLNNKVIEHKKQKKGLYMAVDFNGYLSDQSINFSLSCTHHSFFLNTIETVKKRVGFVECKPIGIFAELDDCRIKKIPSNISNMKKHPFYIIESACRYNEAIYPKRPVVGDFKGTSVYLRSNIVKLRTEGGWYSQGRKLKEDDTATKPYRIYNEKRLFAEFQTVEIVVEGITGKLMDAFHRNFTPKGCVHMNEDASIAEEFGIEYSKTVVGFKGNERLIRGFFTDRRWRFVVKYFSKEKEYYENILGYLKKYEKSRREWKKFLKRLAKLLDIEKRLE
ncbi:hypothetical protein GINT2_000626 [Glugoides intestinalis]